MQTYTLPGGMKIFSYSLESISPKSKLPIQLGTMALIYKHSIQQAIAIGCPGEKLLMPRSYDDDTGLWLLPWGRVYLLDEDNLSEEQSLLYFIFDGIPLIRHLTDRTPIAQYVTDTAKKARRRKGEAALLYTCQALEPFGLCARTRER